LALGVGTAGPGDLGQKGLNLSHLQHHPQILNLPKILKI